MQKGLWATGAPTSLIPPTPTPLHPTHPPPAQDIKPANPWENQSPNSGSLDLCCYRSQGEIHELDNPPSRLTLCGHKKRGFPVRSGYSLIMAQKGCQSVRIWTRLSLCSLLISKCSCPFDEDNDGIFSSTPKELVFDSEITQSLPFSVSRSLW